MSTIGEVNEIPCEFVTQWKIKEFMQLSSKEDESYFSPNFSFAGITWCLEICLNEQTKVTLSNGEVTTTFGYIGVYLYRKSSGPPMNLEYTLGLKTHDGKIDPLRNFINDFEKINAYGAAKFLCRSKLIDRKSELMPSDVLTLICKMKYSKPTQITHIESLRQDYKRVLFYGTNHDLVLKVRNEEIHAHRDILKVRSKVFESMLCQDMIEKNSGVIDIPDCDPEAMKQFLLHVYCGKVEKLDENNMIALYYIADKYEKNDLKDQCWEFIKQSISITNFFKIIQLATNHSDYSMLDSATEYFTNNLLEILHTVEWQSFLKNCPTVANALFIKSQEKKK